jgi:trehalose 6-phosphate phosphatase
VIRPLSVSTGEVRGADQFDYNSSTMRSSKNWRDHTDDIATVLGTERPGLITDIDGTLSPIAPTPDAAEVAPACREALRTLADRIFVAAVSGRAAEDARRMVGVEGIVYVGNHGLERLTPNGLLLLPEVERYARDLANLLGQAARTLDLPGIIVEDKGSTGSIHYRQAANPEAARDVILDTIGDLADEAGLLVTQGRKVVEIRPPVDRDKGTAARCLIEAYQLTGALYPGDDTTDVDAFEALHAWRAETGQPALALGVLGPETAATVVGTADLHLAGVDDVAEFLSWLAAQTAP